MNKLLILALFITGLLPSLHGQRIESLSVAVTTEAIGLPFTNYRPLHPGFEIKTTWKTKETDKNIQRYNTNLGAYFHRRVENGIYLGGEYQYTQKLFQQKVGLDFPAGLGYLHSFYPGELYEQDENGEFSVVQQGGRPHFYLNLGTGISYLGASRFQPFIRQTVMVETPFANGIPVILHSFLHVGVNIQLGKNEH